MMVEENKEVDWLTIAYTQAEEADNKIEQLEAEIRELNNRIENYKDQIQALVRDKYRRMENEDH